MVFPFFFLIKQRLFASTFCHVMIKPFFMSISVVSIGEVFTARFLLASETLSLLTGAMFETKAILYKLLLTILKHQNNIEFK